MARSPFKLETVSDLPELMPSTNPVERLNYDHRRDERVDINARPVVAAFPIDSGPKPTVTIMPANPGFIILYREIVYKRSGPGRLVILPPIAELRLAPAPADKRAVSQAGGS